MRWLCEAGQPDPDKGGDRSREILLRVSTSRTGASRRQVSGVVKVDVDLKGNRATVDVSAADAAGAKEMAFKCAQAVTDAGFTSKPAL